MGKFDAAWITAACHYDAARTMTCWWSGIGAQPVIVGGVPTVPLSVGMGACRPEPDDTDGFLRATPCEPAVETSATSKDQVQGRIQVALMTFFAGSVAWARHRRRSVESCLAEHGKADAEGAERLSAAFFAGKEERTGYSAGHCREVAMANVKRLVRSKEGWAATSSIAEWLEFYGRLNVDEVDALCRAAFGARPLAPGWEPHRPSGYDDIEERHVPEAYWPWYRTEGLHDLKDICLALQSAPYRELPLHP